VHQARKDLNNTMEAGSQNQISPVIVHQARKDLNNTMEAGSQKLNFTCDPRNSVCQDFTTASR